MKILALDLGKFKTRCCFFDTETRKHVRLQRSEVGAKKSEVLTTDGHRWTQMNTDIKPTFTEFIRVYRC